MSNAADTRVGHIVDGPQELFQAHRQGYLDALYRRGYAPQYDTWERQQQLNYELGRARYFELKGLRGHGVSWRHNETLKAALARALGADEAKRFSLESLALFSEDKPK
jgi:hypothetical protein